MENLIYEKRKDGRHYFTFFDMFLNKNQICIWFDTFLPTPKVFAYWFDGFKMKEYKKSISENFDENLLLKSFFNKIITRSMNPFIIHTPPHFKY